MRAFSEDEWRRAVRRPISEILAEARREGRVRYFTGLPCRHGHIDERYTACNVCCECVRLRARAKRARDRVRRSDAPSPNPIQ